MPRIADALITATFGSTTTVYVGNIYEKSGSTLRKYYYAGGNRVAMRTGGQTYYLLGDHLGGTNVTYNSSSGQITKLLYKPWGETRFSTGTTPTTWRFTGQREDATIGLYYFNARYLDPQLGQFTQPDTIVPEPGNPQALNRYSYGGNNPVKYRDPSGHCIEAGLTPISCVQVFDFAARTLQQLQALVVQYGPQVIQGVQQFGNQIPAIVDQFANPGQARGPASSNAGNTAGPGGLEPNDPWFRNARTSSGITQSVLEKVRPEYFSPNARFGRAFYVAQRGETAVAEVEAHGSQASQVIRYQVDLSQAKVLDLTNSTVAKAWGYINDPSAYSSHQALAQRAMQQGYNVIKFASYRGSGSNLALLDNPLNPFNYDEWLIPLMVSPGP